MSAFNQGGSVPPPASDPQYAGIDLAGFYAAFRKEGYCTDCWVNANEEPHEPHCNTSRNREVQSDSEVSE